MTSDHQKKAWERDGYKEKYEHQFHMLCSFLGHQGEWTYYDEPRRKAELRELIKKAWMVVHARSKEDDT